LPGDCSKRSVKVVDGLKTHLEGNLLNTKMFVQEHRLGSLDPDAIEVFNKCYPAHPLEDPAKIIGAYIQSAGHV
jgi:hypothetical protein